MKDHFKGSKASEQRRFFDDFAKSKQFDPLDKRSWYGVTWKEIILAVRLTWFSLL
jgi:hypothetical protein